MANLKASKKDIIRSKRNHDRNKHLKTVLKTALKKAQVSIANKSDETQTIVFATCRVIDQSHTKGIIKKNTAGRTKSRLMKAYNHAFQSEK